MNRRRLIAIARKEFIHVIRDWRSLYLSIAIPLFLILLFGYALNMDLKNIPTVIMDQSRTVKSRDFISLFQGSPYFSIRGCYDNYESLRRELDSGKALIAVVIPGDFADKITRNQPVQIQVIADGSDPNNARLALGYAGAIAKIFSQQVSARQIDRSNQNQAVPIELRQRAFYNSDLRSRNNIIPGIIAIVMIVIAAMLTSVTVAKEWEMGTMEQLISTPIRGPELVFGKIIPYYLIGITDVAIAVVSGKLLFDVPLRGSPALLFLMASIFLTGALFFGITLSIVLKKQLIANQTAILASYLPTLLLSGFAFAIENMPEFIQYLTYIVPARYFIAILRGIYLKGIGLEILGLNAFLLTVYALMMIIASNKKIKLKLE